MGLSLITAPLLALGWVRGWAGAERDGAKKQEFRKLNRRLVRDLAVGVAALAAIIAIFEVFGRRGGQGILWAEIPLLILVVLVFDLLRTFLAIHRLR